METKSYVIKKVFAGNCGCLPLSKDMLTLALRQISDFLHTTSSNYSIIEVDSMDEGGIAFSIEDDMGTLIGCNSHIEVLRILNVGVIAFYECHGENRLYETLSGLLKLKGYFLEEL